MLYLYILLPLFGALPLIVTLFKMRRARNVTNNGVTTEAVVVQVILWGTTIRNMVDTLILQYKVEATNEIYQGKATASRGHYKVGDKMSIAYLKDPPYNMTVKGANVYIPILIFTILIFLFVIFAMFKIEELIPEGGYHLR